MLSQSPHAGTYSESVITFQNRGDICELHVVDSGEALLDYLKRRGRYAHLKGSPLPGLILIDMSAPRADRQATFAAIKADRILSAIPTVMLTSSQGKAQKPRVYNLDGVAYLTRHIPFSNLPDLLESLGGSPVVMLSGGAPLYDGPRAYNLGGALYVTRPAHAVARADLLRSLGKYWAFEMVAVAPRTLAA